MGCTSGSLLALPSSIRLGWRGLPGTNALAYFWSSSATKFVHKLTPGANVIKLLTAVSYEPS